MGFKPRKTPLAKLLAAVEDNGGVVSPTKECDLLNCPFDGRFGIDYSSRVLYYNLSKDDEALYGNSAVYSSVHEVGHLFNGLDREVEEPEWFGWEAAMVHCIGADLKEFIAHNADYCVYLESGHDCIGDLSGWEVLGFVIDRVEHAKKLGIVSADNKPVFS